MARKKVVEVTKKTKMITPKMYEVIKRQIITEKSNRIESLNQYTFEVAKDTSKPEIKDAIEAIFEVKVRKVNISQTYEHARRVGNRQGIVPGFKKAVVTLFDGYTLDASKMLG